MIGFIQKAEPSFPPFPVRSSRVYPFPSNKHLEAINNAELSGAITLTPSLQEEISSETTVNSLSFEFARGMQTSHTLRAFLAMKGRLCPSSLFLENAKSNWDQDRIICGVKASGFHWRRKYK